jgi:hypothetical protein
MPPTATEQWRPGRAAAIAVANIGMTPACWIWRSLIIRIGELRWYAKIQLEQDGRIRLASYCEPLQIRFDAAMCRARALRYFTQIIAIVFDLPTRL